MAKSVARAATARAPASDLVLAVFSSIRICSAEVASAELRAQVLSVTVDSPSMRRTRPTKSAYATPLVAERRSGCCARPGSRADDHDAPAFSTRRALSAPATARCSRHRDVGVRSLEDPARGRARRSERPPSRPTTGLVGGARRPCTNGRVSGEIERGWPALSRKSERDGITSAMPDRVTTHVPWSVPARPHDGDVDRCRPRTEHVDADYCGGGVRNHPPGGPRRPRSARSGCSSIRRSPANPRYGLAPGPDAGPCASGRSVAVAFSPTSSRRRRASRSFACRVERLTHDLPHIPARRCRAARSGAYIQFALGEALRGRAARRRVRLALWTTAWMRCAWGRGSFADRY